MPIIAIALIIAAALGGSTAFAAQQSLPGDALWNFKTTVNEGLQGALAQGDTAKANWDISVAADRLEEAKQLAAKGSLNASAQAQLTANLDEHAKEVASLVAKLKAEGKASVAADIATRFQATLAAHAADVSAEAGSGNDVDIEPFLTDIRGTLDAAASLSASANADVAAEDRGDAAETGGDTASSSEGSTGAGATVHTGTSVRGGEGGIRTNADGSVIGI